MKMLKKYRFVYMALAVVLLLSACIPGTAPDGSTIDATQAAALVGTAVAQALDAQATQAAASVPEASPTAVMTNTPIPAPATLTPVPTITPLVLAPTATAASGGGGGGGGGGGTITYPDACDEGVSSTKKPYDLTGFKAGDPFDIKFTIVNTGTTTWAFGKDLVHVDGPDMTTAGFPFVELPEMKPGDSFTVGPYDAIAPAANKNAVNQGMYFKLEGGFCWPYIVITVK